MSDEGRRVRRAGGQIRRPSGPSSVGSVVRVSILIRAWNHGFAALAVVLRMGCGLGFPQREPDRLESEVPSHADCGVSRADCGVAG